MPGTSGDSASRDVQHEIQLALARIETKLDAVIASVNDHEVRIRQLERTVWMVGGAAATVGGVIGTLLPRLFGN